MLQRGAKDDEDGTQWALHKCCREFLHPVMSELPLPGCFLRRRLGRGKRRAPGRLGSNAGEGGAARPRHPDTRAGIPSWHLGLDAADNAAQPAALQLPARSALARRSQGDPACSAPASLTAQRTPRPAQRPGKNQPANLLSRLTVLSSLFQLPEIRPQE